MGWSFRRSVNFGPLRFNFSKSGVGVSAGVKGTRASTGPRGTYIRVGSNGVYYRQKIGASPPVHGNAEVNAPPAEPVREPMSDLAVFLNGEREKASGRLSALIGLTVVTVLVAVGLIAAAGVNLPGDPARALTFLILFLAASVIFLISRFSYRPRHVLEFDAGAPSLTGFGKVREACRALEGCAYLACASSGTRGWQTARLVKKPPPFIWTGLEIYSVEAGPNKIFFLPDQLLLLNHAGFSGAKYSALHIGYSATRVIQNSAPAGAEIGGYTWLHTRKDGFADMRYKYNPRMPIVVYGIVTLAGPNGYQISFQTTPSACARAFAELLTGQPEQKKSARASQERRQHQQQHSQSSAGPRDELFNQALRTIVEMKRASTSVLQRRLNIGYGRAAAIIDAMEREGFVGQADGASPRPVLGKAFEAVAAWDRESTAGAGRDQKRRSTSAGSSADSPYKVLEAV
jgi:ribosomal protein S25